ncbi:MAG: helix-turn-helix transcriptional regulator [Bacilli bacterium]|nr:helix-turn-helix transcriptional regulator [Bacilli bacterium]
MIDNEKVGKFIAKLRKEKNMTQDDLAIELSVDRTIISKWERGIYIPNAEFLLKMQTFFDVTINEILYGERKNVDNNDKIDSIPVDIINNTKKRIKRYTIFFISIINFLIISFLIYYFINNYNSIKVYKIYGENSNFGVNNGIMIFSKEKSYIKLGKIYNYSNKKIINIELCYEKNNKEITLYSGSEDNSDYLIVNRFNYNELYEYKDIPLIINGLYIKITMEDGNIEFLKLKFKKDFSNNKIIVNNIFSISDNKNIDDDKLVISNHILSGYEYNSDERYFFKNYVNDNINYLEKYYKDINKVVLLKTDDIFSEYYEFDLSNKIVNCSYFENEELIDYYDYDFESDKCIYGNCNKNNVLFIKEKYINKYLKNNN